MQRLSILAVVIALMVAPATGAEKQAGNPDISVGTCIEHGGADDQPEGSAIRTCCLDSDLTGIRGCYICDYKWENCTWEPAPEKGGGKVPTVPDKGQLDDLLQPQDLKSSD
jgi:hypothetical protein